MEEPPLLEDFCQFCVNLHARRMVVTHLEELGRGIEDYWDREHYAKAAARIRLLMPEMEISSARLGESIGL